jgi:hypothetical protein
MFFGKVAVLLLRGGVGQAKEAFLKRILGDLFKR